jgi:hypothetical protein
VYQHIGVPIEIFAQKAEAVWKRRKLLGSDLCGSEGREAHSESRSEALPLDRY